MSGRKQRGDDGKAALLVELSGGSVGRRVLDGRKVGQPHSCVIASRDPRDWCHCISLSGRRKREKHQRHCDVQRKRK